MLSKYVHCVGFWWPKTTIFGQILTFGGSCTDLLLPMRAKFGVLQQTQGPHVHAKCHLNVFTVSASGGQKPQFWANFDFWGVCCTDPLLPMGQIWCAIADPWSTHMCQISSRSVYSVTLCWRKTPMFALFWTSAFSGVTNRQQSEKVEHGCTTTNLPLSNGIKILSVLQCLHGVIRCTISDVQKHDGQTSKQTDEKLNVFGRPGGG